jgi:hypothetical protein
MTDISIFIKSQIPAHLRSNELFVQFLVSYYTWLSKFQRRIPEVTRLETNVILYVDIGYVESGYIKGFTEERVVTDVAEVPQEFNPAGLFTNLSTILDIDRTFDIFLDMFSKTYASAVYASNESAAKLLVKNIRSIYEAKGTPGAIKSLFRILYQEEINITTPYDSTMLVSGGVWKVPKKIRVNVAYGDASDIENSWVAVDFGGTKRRLPVVRAIPVFNPLDAGGVYLDLEFENLGDLNIPPSTLITLTDRFRGSVVHVPTKYKILSPGTGFQIGQKFELIDNNGYGSVVRVTKITPEGGISALAFDERGFGYTKKFSATLTSSGKEFSKSDTPGRYTDSVNFGDSGTVLVNGVEWAKFGKGASIVKKNESAIIEFDVYGNYDEEGYFLSGTFISDSSLYDGFYFQQYSYEISTTAELSDYEDILKRTVHPAGTKNFSKRRIENTLSPQFFAGIENVPIVALINDSFDFDDDTTVQKFLSL